MEAKFGGKIHQFCVPVTVISEGMGKENKEWNLNDCTWDSHLCKATLSSCKSKQQLFPGGLENTGASSGISSGLDNVAVMMNENGRRDCMSKPLFPVGPENTGAGASIPSMPGDVNENGKRDSEKRRRYVEVENEQVNEEAGELDLKLGGLVYPNTDDQGELSGKRTKVVSGAPSSTRPVCQVEDCKADLSNAKDYHRRHKVCCIHSKANAAVVGNVTQRFCQQCSRFHVLQEFDEGKRSCRKRLAGHNKRRRKTHPEREVDTLNDDRVSILRSLLGILTNNQSNSIHIDPELLSAELLSDLRKNVKNVENAAGTADARTAAELLAAKFLSVSQCSGDVGTSLTTADPRRAAGPSACVPSSGLYQKGVTKDFGQGGFRPTESASKLPVEFPAEASNSVKENTDDKVGRTSLNNFDLNSVYDGSEDDREDVHNTITHGDHVNLSSGGSLWLQKDVEQSSPPQNTGNSGYTSSQSRSTSSGETQGRTDRIVFKLFGKDPSDFPNGLRKQILDWLSNSPTDMESHIRPGCIILTIYLRMDESTWEELHCNLKSSLGRLLDSSTHTFWRTGWIYTRVRNRATFVYNGRVVVDTPLPMKDDMCCRISSIKPIAATILDTVMFEVKGFNLSRPTSSMLCTLEGKLLVQENCSDMTRRGSDSFVEQHGIQSISFFSVLPNIIGRGFIEVEDHGLSSSFFPFIVAEKDVCIEIRTLEIIIEAIEVGNGDANALLLRNQALYFLNEMGWLLHKSHIKLRLGQTTGDLDDLDLFPFERFRWLIEFSTDRNWCAVVKKLLSILFEGIVDSGQRNSVLLALLDVGLLHRAVRRNCKSMVEFLLKYRPREALEEMGSEQEYPYSGSYLFRPDSVGPGGLTPIHIAAGLENYDHILDALTEDPGQVGIKAWKNAQDSTGLTPHDYACIRGHYSYIHLVQRKLDQESGNGHVTLDVPTRALDGSIISQKINDSGNGVRLDNTESNRVIKSRRCGQCELNLAYRSAPTSLTMYRPAMISLVIIATVCVCAALLFKSSPDVLCSTKPFRWDVLGYGSQ